jgi:outer membrane receptor protein involved in Fe transport
MTLLMLFVLASISRAQDPATAKDQGAQSPDLLSMDIESLMNLQVTTASRFSDKLSEAPSIMSVVTSDELRRFGGLTLAEILERVTGLTMSSQYFTDRSLIAARGDQTKTAGGHILFLINGRPTREVMEGGIISDLLESFPVGILDRIEVIRGPGSVLYGSNAFSSVINLITKKANGASVTAEGLGGENGALASSAEITYKRGDFNVVGAGQLHEAPDWAVTYTVPPTQRNIPVAPHQPNVQDVSVVDRGVGSYLGANYKGLSFMSAFTEWQSTAFVQGNVGETRLTRDFANLGYDLDVRKNWQMSFNGTYTRTTFGETPYPSALRDSDESIAEWTNLITLSSKDRLTAGGLFNRISGTEYFTGGPVPTVSAQGNRLGGAFYAQIDHQLRRDLKLIGGVQSNKIGALSLSTVPRGGVVWSPRKWASLKVLYGQAFRAPSLDENLLNRPGVVGNPNLLPEKVGTLDVGSVAQSGRYEGGVDYFYSKQTNSIVAVLGSPSHYVNLGELTFNGTEFEGKYYLQKDFFLQGSFMYQTNQTGTGASNVTPIANFSGKGGISYQASNGITASVFDVSDGPITPYPNAVNPVQGTHNIVNVEVRYDLSKRLHLSDRNDFAFALHGTNLAGHSIWLPGFGFNSIDSIPVQQGRVIYAGLVFTLGKK